MSTPLSTPDDDFLKRRQAKLSLLRHIYALLAQWRQGQTADLRREPNPQEKFMQALFGIILAVIGLIAATVLGLPRAFSPDWETAAVALFLVMGGEVAVLSGAWLTKYYYLSNARLGQVLFGVGFVLSVAVVIVGFIHIFSDVGASIFLVVVGFLGAFTSALALK